MYDIEDELRDLSERYANRIGAPTSNVLSVIAVETSGSGLTAVSGSTKPIIRWEGHYFYRGLRPWPDAQRAAVVAGLADPVAGGVKNHRRQVDRHAFLQTALEFCDEHGLPRSLAYDSISMGFSQIMGTHAHSLGYSDSEEMFGAASSSLAQQFVQFEKLLQQKGLVESIITFNPRKIATRWNGRLGIQRGYHLKLIQAEKFFRNGDVDERPILRKGSSGLFVREVQEKLRDLGYPVGRIDGAFGGTTRGAVLTFQADNNLTTDGAVGTETWAALDTAQPREISESRKSATLADLRNSGSEIVASADRQSAAAAVAGLGGLSGVAGVASEASGAFSQIGYAFRSFTSAVGEHWWVIVIALAVFFYWQSMRTRKSRLEDHRSGRNLGR